MTRHTEKRRRKVGLPPGTLISPAEKRTEKVKITLIDYDEGEFQEKQVQTIEECLPF